MIRRVLVTAVVLLAACSGRASDDGGKPVEARIPDVEGVVTAVDEGHITIDGDVLDLADDASSVSTYTGDAVPVRVGTFVHVGVRDELVRWVATIGIVTRGTPARVRYTGTVVRETNDRVVFTDGTALRAATDLDVPTGFVAVELDPATGEIASFSR